MSTSNPPLGTPLNCTHTLIYDEVSITAVMGCKVMMTSKKSKIECCTSLFVIKKLYTD